MAKDSRDTSKESLKPGEPEPKRATPPLGCAGNFG